MLQENQSITIKANSIGYLHPNGQDDYTGRESFPCETTGIITKVPEFDKGFNSFFVRLDNLDEGKNPDLFIYAFKSVDLVGLPVPVEVEI